MKKVIFMSARRRATRRVKSGAVKEAPRETARTTAVLSGRKTRLERPGLVAVRFKTETVGGVF